MKHTTQPHLSTPSVEDVGLMYDPPPASFCKGGDDNKDVVAIGTAVYSGVVPAAYDSHRNMCLYSAWDLGPGNLWVLPTMARLTYPFAPLYSVASLLKTEKVTGKRADWFVWIDDDVVVPKDLIRKLRMAADPEKRPYVAAVGFDRYPPFRAAVWQRFHRGELIDRKQWVVGEPENDDQMTMPTSGVHEVDCTGLCAAIFHRSFFDKVPQPWFSSLPPTITDDDVDSKINPDAWLAQKCNEAGVPIHVTCDVEIGHVGLSTILNPRTVAALQGVYEK